MAGEVDRHHVEARLRQRARPDLMKADSELRLVDMNTKIAVVDCRRIFRAGVPSSSAQAEIPDSSRSSPCAARVAPVPFFRARAGSRCARRLRRR